MIAMCRVIFGIFFPSQNTKSKKEEEEKEWETHNKKNQQQNSILSIREILYTLLYEYMNAKEIMLVSSVVWLLTASNSTWLFFICFFSCVFVILLWTVFSYDFCCCCVFSFVHVAISRTFPVLLGDK